MTAEEIKEINNYPKRKWDSWNQGVFTEPSWIPNTIKEPVVYMRWNTGGMSGGSCWGDEATPYYNSDKPDFLVLDHLLSVLKPSITYLQYKHIQTMIHTSNETSWEYYGNSDDYEVSYIVLSELETYLNSI